MAVTGWNRALCISMCAGLAIVVWGASPFGTPGAAQPTATPSPPAYDESIRALQYYRYKRVAESGPERGRELYYFKCWQCHNEFQKTAPQLNGLYQRANLVTGVPVNDASVADHIQNGSPGMPSFRYELTMSETSASLSS